MKRLSVYIIILITMGCTSEKSQFVTKPRMDNYLSTKSEVNLNGCYYATYQNPRDNTTELAYFFFYKNGIAVFSHAGEVKKDSVSEKKYLVSNIEKDISFKEKFFNNKEAGGFLINSKNIQIQIYRFIPAPAWGICTFNGSIINDTTILISKCEMKKRPDYCRENFYLKFISFPKPDSLNQLMNKKWYWQ